MESSASPPPVPKEVEGMQELEGGGHYCKSRLLDMTRLLYPQTQNNCGYVQRTCLRLIPALHPQREWSMETLLSMRTHWQ